MATTISPTRPEVSFLTPYLTLPSSVPSSLYLSFLSSVFNAEKLQSECLNDDPSKLIHCHVRMLGHHLMFQDEIGEAEKERKGLHKEGVSMMEKMKQSVVGAASSSSIPPPIRIGLSFKSGMRETYNRMLVWEGEGGKKCRVIVPIGVSFWNDLYAEVEDIAGFIWSFDEKITGKEGMNKEKEGVSMDREREKEEL